MASTRTRSRMPDLSANLNENTTCSPLSDLWNFPQSKLFPANGQQQRAASPTVVAANGATAAATPELDSHSVAPIGQHPTEFKLGQAHSHGPAFPSTLWSRPGSANQAASTPVPQGIDSPNPEIGQGSPGSISGTLPVSVNGSVAGSVPGSVAGSVASASASGAHTPVTGPVSGPGQGSAQAASSEPPSLLLGPQGSPSNGSFRSQPRNGGIWGAEYSGFRHPHPAVSAFGQGPSSTGRIVSGPFGLKTGPVRALDQTTASGSPTGTASIPPQQPGLPVGLAAAGNSPVAPRSLDSSWDRTAFKQQGRPHHHQVPQVPGAVQVAQVPQVPQVSQVPQVPGALGGSVPPATSILSVHQQQQLHQQQQQQQQHRAQKKGGRPSTNTELYKTELCASYMSTGGNCPYGEKCQFAHGTQELKTVDRPPKWRSKPCQNWVKTGTCSYNERCCFRHDVPVAPQ